MIAAALTLALQLSGPSVAPGAPVGDGAWIPVDGVLAVAGSRVITRQQWTRSVQAAMASNPVATLEQEEELRRDVMRSEVLALLTAQAGAELDLPPEMIATELRLRREANAERMGVVGYRDALASSGIDPLDMDRVYRDQLLRGQWEAYTVGQQSFPGLRPVVDNFIRPGELRMVYYVEKDRLSKPGTVSLQILALPAAAAGGQANAEAAGAAWLAEIEGGASLTQMVEMNGGLYRDTKGVVEDVPVPNLPPGLRDFVALAAPGQLSGVLPLVTPDGRVDGIQIVRLLERSEGDPAPPFRTPALQSNLRQLVSTSRERQLIEIGQEELVRAAYSWLHPAVRPAPRSGPGQGQ